MAGAQTTHRTSRRAAHGASGGLHAASTERMSLSAEELRETQPLRQPAMAARPQVVSEERVPRREAAPAGGASASGARRSQSAAGQRATQPLRESGAAADPQVASEEQTPKREGSPLSNTPVFMDSYQASPRIDQKATEIRQALEKEEEKKRREKLKEFARSKTPEKLKGPSDLQVRFRTGFVYVLLTVVGLLAGNIPCVIMLSITAGMCAGEFYYVLRSDDKLPNEVLGIIAAILYPPAAYWLGMVGIAELTLIFMLALLVWYVFWMRARIADVCISFFGAAYTGLLLSSVILVRAAIPAPWGGVTMLVIFCSVWGNDAFAYLVGSRIGKHKMVPHISPKKSWEGFIAGMITSMLIWCILIPIPGVDISVVQALAFGLICGIMSVIGDLAESRIKRNSGVKDSGTIMPGHGGLLDRCDSMFLASATAVILLMAGGCIPYVF